MFLFAMPTGACVFFFMHNLFGSISFCGMHSTCLLIFFSFHLFWLICEIWRNSACPDGSRFSGRISVFPSTTMCQRNAHVSDHFSALRMYNFQFAPTSQKLGRHWVQHQRLAFSFLFLCATDWHKGAENYGANMEFKYSAIQANDFNAK